MIRTEQPIVSRGGKALRYCFLLAKRCRQSSRKSTKSARNQSFLINLNKIITYIVRIYKR
uniref:Uncharacterized protein n=1 Tax=Romanomermis culicivorax TaxID=13658 RepID=A0A915JWV3_ROMCU